MMGVSEHVFGVFCVETNPAKVDSGEQWIKTKEVRRVEMRSPRRLPKRKEQRQQKERTRFKKMRKEVYTDS